MPRSFQTGLAALTERNSPSASNHLEPKPCTSKARGAIHATNTAPIKVFGNDATGTFGVVWIAMHDFVFSADISRNRDLGSYFRLSLGTPSGKYFDYTADIEKIRKHLHGLMKRMVICG